MSGDGGWSILDPARRVEGALVTPSAAMVVLGFAHLAWPTVRSAGRPARPASLTGRGCMSAPIERDPGRPDALQPLAGGEHLPQQGRLHRLQEVTIMARLAGAIGAGEREARRYPRPGRLALRLPVDGGDEPT